MSMYRYALAFPVLCSSVLLVITGLLQGVQGHLYMMKPVSRNLWGTTAFNDPSYEYINYCPHCYQSRGPAMVRDRGESLTDPEELARYGGGAWPLLVAYEMRDIEANGNYLESDAISVRHGICGDPEQTSSEGSNRYSRANVNYPVIDTYTEGSILEVKIVVSTSHMGHLELFLCNTDDMDDPDGVVTQGCFNMHPLDRAEDDGVASPIDPNHPGRYYLDPPCRASETDQTLLPGVFPGYVVTGRYQLPAGVTCSRCIVQMVYYTGNSCMHVGYDEFNPKSWPSECAPNKRDWIVTGLGLCGDGNNYPEEYWNCADIKITTDGRHSEPVSEPARSESASQETPSPVAVEAQEPGKPGTNGAEPFAEAIAVTSPPAVFAPSVVASEMPQDDCDDPIAAYGQCGGDLYEGSTCCSPGFTCTKVADCYSECRPIAEDACSEGWGQCGGRNWEGPTCCWGSAKCRERNEWYSHCVPENRV